MATKGTSISASAPTSVRLHAATAHNDRAREVWAKMEQYWRKRAAGAEAPLVPAQPVEEDLERVR